VDNNQRKISWTRGLLNSVKKGMYFDEEIEISLRDGSYRPFCKEYLFCNKLFNEVPSQIPKFFPSSKTENFLICSTGLGITKPFSVLTTDNIPDFHYADTSQCFSRYYYEPFEQSSLLPSGFKVVIDCYVHRDAITDGILEKARAQYGSEAMKDDVFFYVYGALHSSSYHAHYANDLKKELVRLPLPSPGVFWQCSAISRELADVHLNYETGKSTLGDRSGRPYKKLEPTPLRWETKAPSDLPDS